MPQIAIPNHDVVACASPRGRGYSLISNLGLNENELTDLNCSEACRSTRMTSNLADRLVSPSREKKHYKKEVNISETSVNANLKRI